VVADDGIAARAAVDGAGQGRRRAGEGERVVLVAAGQALDGGEAAHLCRQADLHVAGASPVHGEQVRRSSVLAHAGVGAVAAREGRGGPAVQVQRVVVVATRHAQQAAAVQVERVVAGPAVEVFDVGDAATDQVGGRAGAAHGEGVGV